MSEYVIGVDIGTGSTKALAIGLQGQVIHTAQVHYPTLTPRPGLCEQEPLVIWQAFVQCIRKITSRLVASPQAIGLSTAMHSLIPVDGSGTPLHNMIIWADNRSAEIATRIRTSSSGKRIYEQTGTPIHAMSPLCKIIWIRENDADLFHRTYKFISIKEYIWHRIFNSFEIDHSIASATGLMDIQFLQWSTDALAWCGITGSNLSSLVGTGYSRKDVMPGIPEQLGIPSSTAFVIGGSDGCLANLGSFAVEPGVAALTIGTSGAVRVASRAPVNNFEAMIFNYRLDEETFVCGGPTNNGGNVLKWYVESFLDKKLATQSDYDAILKTLEHTAPGAEGLLFLPYLFGERAPLWDSNVSGIFYGVRSRHTQEHFTRAVVEGITMALYDIAENMIRNGLDIAQVHVSGGFVRSAAWLQTLANIFNKKICLINSDDASALGAGLISLKVLDRIPSYDSLKPAVIKEILPEKKFVSIYQQKFEMYRKLSRGVSDTSIDQLFL